MVLPEISLKLKERINFSLFAKIFGKGDHVKETTYEGKRSLLIFDQYITSPKDYLTRGVSGKVVKAYDISREIHVAIKILKFKKNIRFSQYRSQKAEDISEYNKYLENEIQAINNLCKKNTDAPILVFDNIITKGRKVFVVMPLCEGGDLRTKLEELPQSRLEEAEAKPIFHDVLLALQYLKDQGYAHRDVKPANIAFKDGKAYLIDYGISCPDVAEGTKECFITSCGTPGFIAPEILSPRLPFVSYSQADVWSFGMTLFATLMGGMLTTPDWMLPFFVYKSLSKDACDLLRKTLLPDATDRLTVEECLNHPWFTSSLQ